MNSVNLTLQTMARLHSTAWFVFFVSMLFSLPYVSVVHADDAERKRIEFFEAKIRPVLINECYGCHSADAVARGKLRGELLLDSREGSLKGGETGPAIVAGKPDESLLIDAIRHQTLKMPPKGKLSDTAIQDFVRWVEMGAPDPRDGKASSPARNIDIQAGKQFWSFQPLAKIKPTHSSEECKSPIDQFVYGKLVEKGIQPNGIAQPRILVRRAWFDLLGLPPTPEEMNHWVAQLTDRSSAEDKTNSTPSRVNERAWSDLIDHLLESPHFGERWARHWMDVARFAESHGYEQDYDRPNAYYYRDFLIKAFNSDLPYDQFVRWQMAGDELALDNPLAWMATGFLGGGAFPTQLTENEFESARYDELDDMVTTTGVAFLGLSIGCARCHDHKFDPIPAKDYYSLAATFSKAIRTEKEFDLEPDQNEIRRKEYQEEREMLGREVASIERGEVRSRLLTFLRSPGETPKPSPWQRLEGELSSSSNSKFEKLEDGSYLAIGNAPAKEVLTFKVWPATAKLHAIRLEAMQHESLPKKGPGRADNGNFVLGNFEVFSASNEKLRVAKAEATFQQDEGGLSVAASIDDSESSGWAIDGQIGRDNAAVFHFAEPIELKSDSALSIRMTFHHPNAKHLLGRMRLTFATEPNAELTVGESGPSPQVHLAITRLQSMNPPNDTDAVAQWIESHGSDWQIALEWFKTTIEPWRAASSALRKHESVGPQVRLSKIMVTSEGLPHMTHHADGRGYPHFYPVTYQLRRGDVAQKGDVAEPGFLQVLHAQDNSRVASVDESGTKSPRSRLANWITDTRNGAGQLAARVIANRLWQHHFGQGLVSTPNDFGTTGERPTHPELLDWLANDLIENGWRLKSLHKKMMLSSVYMQSSATNTDAQGTIDARFGVDPDNRLHWRRSPSRLEAEAIRDSLLAVSGALDTQLYGPGTLDQNMNRRSVYFFIKRSQLIPVMMLFDWPEHLVSIGQRANTTIAPQALMFINNPQGRSYAESFAKLVLNTDQSSMVENAYRRAFGRDPTASERTSAIQFIEQQRTVRASEPIDQRERNAVADFCQILFSANEFVYVD